MTTFFTIIRTSAVGAATVLALGLLMLTVGTSPAQATFPGTNGKIVFTEGPDGEADHISTMNPDGSGLTRFRARFGSSPLWSPDGSRIAFQSGQDGNNEIYVMNADDSSVRRLTNNPAFDLPGSWSPDGTKIEFFFYV
ncbi:MAG: PD40 domain-containing protein [Rubrobacter sp.]|nr:PD40 domain-containing protein [Rubrobacter sp.]